MIGQTLRTVVSALDAAGIAHMVGGSVASTHHGEPRSTQDIDIVIDPSIDQLDLFLAALPPGRFYVDDAQAALTQRSMFNLVDGDTGWKIDLMFLRDRPFSRSEFARRIRARVEGVELAVATPEDTILAKLDWARDSRSERQLRDCSGLLGTHRGHLDEEYLDHWAAELGVEDLLAECREAAIRTD